MATPKRYKKIILTKGFNHWYNMSRRDACSVLRNNNWRSYPEFEIRVKLPNGDVVYFRTDNYSFSRVQISNLKIITELYKHLHDNVYECSGSF
jgi:hypothetical protein